MRIETLSLRGLLRFADVVTLDLRDLPPGLIAIVGENGAGKSTLLEAPVAALYRSFLSRDGELYDYAGGRRDAFLEAEIAVDGRGTYRARLNIDGLKRTTDAVLESIQPNGTRAVLNDGKASTFSAVVAEHFPSKELLLASAFATQNKAGSFTTLDKKNRKELFSTLLGLDHLIAMSETARQALGLVDQAKTRLVAVRDELARDTADGILEALTRQAQQLQIEFDAAELTRLGLHTTIAELETRLALVQDQVAAYAAATQRVKTLETELALRREDRRRVDVDQTAAAAHLRTDLAALGSALEAELKEIANKIAGNEGVLEQAAGIRASVAAIATLDHQLEACRAQERTLATRATDLLSEGRAIEREMAALAALETRHTRAAADAELLEQVPCSGAGQYAACRFLTNAAEAKAQVPYLEGELGRKPAIEDRATVARTKATEVQTAALQTQERIDRLTKERTGHQALAKYSDNLAAAEARIAELKAKQQEASQRAEDGAEQATLRHVAALDRSRERAEDLNTTIARLAGELETAQADLEATAAGNTQAVQLQGTLTDRRAEWDQVTRTIARLEAGRGELERRHQDLEAKRTRVQDLQGRVTQLDTERLEWQLLAKAFGRDGLPVLEIDAAGPTISAYTNELLAVCFGTRFTVDLITQRASADGKKMVDDFSIRVFDNARGGDDRDIADLSGGEKVIVAEALMNAIAVYVNTRSPMPIRTCWRDETTGALDPENAVRYIAMLRKVQELAGVHHTFFITHNPDCAALADAQLQVADGKVAIVLPPFLIERAA